MKRMGLFVALLAAFVTTAVEANCGPQGCGYYYQMGFNGGFNVPPSRPMPFPQQVGFRPMPRPMPRPFPMQQGFPQQPFPPQGGIPGMGMPGMGMPMPMPIGTHGGYPGMGYPGMGYPGAGFAGGGIAVGGAGFAGGGFVAGGGGFVGGGVMIRRPVMVARGGCGPRGCAMVRPCATVRCRPVCRTGCFGRGRRC